MAMPTLKISQKGRLMPRPRRYAPRAMAAAKPQAKICRRFASRDPVVVVPSVAASQRCNATTTAARIRGFRSIPCRTLSGSMGANYPNLFYGGIPRALRQSVFRRALPDTGLCRSSRRLILARIQVLPSLASLEGVAVLRLHGGSNAAAQGNGVHGRALGETLEHGHLSGKHVAFVNGGDGAPGFTLDALSGVIYKHARGVHHGLRSGFALGRRGFLRAQQAGFYRVDFHHDIRECADQLLFVGELFAEFLDCASGRL